MALEVFVIDDQPVFQQLLREILEESRGVKVTLFADGRAAMAHICATGQLPDAVVNDRNYKLPDYDGMAFLREFKALPGAGPVPVLLHTADQDITQASLTAYPNVTHVPKDGSMQTIRIFRELAERGLAAKGISETGAAADSLRQSAHKLPPEQEHTIS